MPKPVDKHRADMVQYKQPGGMPSAGKRAWNAIGKAIGKATWQKGTEHT